MDIEPMDPRQGPIGGPGQPILRDGAIPTPEKPGAPQVGITNNPKAGEGWRKQVKPAPADPKDVVPPKYVTKT